MLRFQASREKGEKSRDKIRIAFKMYESELSPHTYHIL